MEKENSNRTRIVGMRFTQKEYALIEKRWRSSTCRKLSDYIRRHLFNKPITTNYRNESLDEFMIEMIRLRKELNSIGSNLNQEVKKLHVLKRIPELKTWILKAEIDQKVLLNKTDEIKKQISKISEEWLLS